MVQSFDNPALTSVHKLECLERLGNGLGAGRYKGKLRNQRVVVILPAHGDRRAFVAWATRLGQVEHPGLPRLEHLEESDPSFAAFTYIEGETLDDRLNSGRGFSDIEALGVIFQIAAALRALHRQGLPHTHISARHVILSPRNNAVDLAQLVSALPPRSEIRDAQIEEDLEALGRLLYRCLSEGSFTTQGPLAGSRDELALERREVLKSLAIRRHFQCVDDFVASLLPHLQALIDQGVASASSELERESGFAREVERYEREQRELETRLRSVRSWLHESAARIEASEAQRAALQKREGALVNLELELSMLLERPLRRRDRGSRDSVERRVIADLGLTPLSAAAYCAPPAPSRMPSPARPVESEWKSAIRSEARSDNRDAHLEVSTPRLTPEIAAPSHTNSHNDSAVSRTPTGQHTALQPIRESEFESSHESAQLPQPTENKQEFARQPSRYARRTSLKNLELWIALGLAVTFGIALIVVLVRTSPNSNTTEPKPDAAILAAAIAVDAAIQDATVLDAEILDAAVPDAEIPDVAIPDAEIPDAEVLDFPEIPIPQNTPVELGTPPAGMVAVQPGVVKTGLTDDQRAELRALCKVDFAGHALGKDCSSASFANEPANEVEVAGFYIDKYEVSQADYERCRLAGKCKRLKLHWDMTTQPATALTREMAEAYCTWRNARLPTAEEWLLAARGSDDRIYPWGDEPVLSSTGKDGARANCGEFARGERRGSPIDGYKYASPVNAFDPQGQSPSGAMNMAGNAREWTQSTIDDKAVVMGGSWRDLPHELRVTRRELLAPNFTDNDLGLRCALSPKP